MIGFTVVFSLLGLFAGTLGTVLAKYQVAVNIVCGAIVVLFGLSYLGVIPLNFMRGVSGTHDAGGVLSAFLFGLIYSVSLTPCVGAFLGSALMLAASTGGALKGLLLLLVYSLGLGIPFVLSAVLLDKLKGTFAVIKRHYKVINTVCGIFLILVGAAMALGLLNRLMAGF
ncbi:MAG: sulfite exporter TauE/SafE family protein [Oscillospiraceae bacterium]|nr:sulfite exporter TauE/SafE family protein [Oscillospiraceae bacterium]